MINKLVPYFLSLMYIFFVDVAASSDGYANFDEVERDTASPLQQNLSLLSGDEKSWIHALAIKNGLKPEEQEKARILIGEKSVKGKEALDLYDSIRNMIRREQDEANKIWAWRFSLVSALFAAASTGWQVIETVKDEGNVNIVGPITGNCVSVGLAFLTTVAAGFATQYSNS